MPLGACYREWLLSLSRLEADAGCPRVLGIKSEMAMYFADLTETWEPESRYNLMCALIKKLCAGNYGYPPIPVTEAESAALAHWHYPSSQRVSFFRTPGLSGNPDIEATVRAANRAAKVPLGGYKIDKPLLKRRLKQAMVGRFGKSSDGHYITQVKDLKVRIVFDFGVRWGDQFEYMQSIETRRGERLLVHGGILTLLGWPQTRWGRLTNEDIPATASLVARLCEEFVDAVPGMWDRSGLASEQAPG